MIYLIIYSGDERSSKRRIKKGLEVLTQLGLAPDKIIFTGFNAVEQHDASVNITGLYDDPRLREFAPYIQGAKVEYARNTIENALSFYDVLKDPNARAIVVTDDFHVKRAAYGLSKVYGRAWLNKFKFVTTFEANDKIRRRAVLHEIIGRAFYELLMIGIARGNYEKVKQLYAKRRAKVEKLASFVKNLIRGKN